MPRVKDGQSQKNVTSGIVPLNKDIYNVYQKDGMLQNPELVLRVSTKNEYGNLYAIDRLHSMVAQDTFIGACVELRKLLIGAFNYEVLCDDDSENCKKITQFVQKNIYENIQFSELQQAMLDAMVYGFSVVEKYFRKAGTYWELSGFKDLHPGTIGFNRNLEMYYFPAGYQGVVVSDSAIPLSPLKWKFVHWAYKPRYGNPYGTSILDLGIYKNFLYRKELFNLFYLYMSRYGNPLMYGQYSSLTSQEIENFKTDIANFAADQRVVLPEGCNIVALDLDVQDGTKVFEAFDRMTKELISNRLLYQNMAAQDSGAGSYARDKVLKTIMDQALYTDAVAFSNVFSRQVINPLVDMNFGRQEYYPYLNITLPESFDEKTRAEVVKLFADMKLPISTAQIREQFNFSEPVDQEDKLGYTEGDRRYNE